MRKLRTLVALITVAALVLSLGGFASAQQFTDIPANASYAKAVDLLVKLGVVTGFPDNTYRPDELLTREQFAAFVIRALGRDKLAKAFMDQATTFKDDGKISSWARGYVVLASSMKIITGFPDGTFKPQEEVTYGQVFAMLIRALGFDDYAKAKGGWLAGYLLTAEDLGLTAGIESFVPDLPIDRADMAVATFNGVTTSYKINKDTGALEKVDKGEASLLRRVFGYSESDYNAWKSPANTVAGKVEALLASSNRIKVAGTEFTYNADTEVVLNGKSLGKGETFVEGNVAKDTEVTVEYGSNNTATKISVTKDTYTNALLTYDDVALDEGETAFGKIKEGKISATDQVYAVNVTSATKVLLDGASATWADVVNALKGLKDTYKTDGKGIFAVIRTHGHTKATSGAVDAVYVSVVTKNTISGKVTAKGSDSSGTYVRIKPDSGDEVKVYYAGIDPAVGATVTLLRDAKDVARVILKSSTSATVTTTVFWAHALSVEYTTVGSQAYLMNINAHTAKMDQPVTTTYAGKQDSSGNYITAINATYVAANKVVALKVVDGKVESAWGYDQGSWTALSDGAATSPSTLGFQTGDPSSVTSTFSGLYLIQYTGPNIFAGPDTIILKSDGTHSALKLSDLTDTNRTKIAAVFYVTKDGVNSAQVILLDVAE